MLIREVIDRVDKLLNNEYTDEEKYHWCDVVSAEINAIPSRRYKKAVLERCADGTFLLPQDCEYERIEKLLIGRRETAKQDFRTYGISRRAERRIFIPKKWHSFALSVACGDSSPKGGAFHKADAVTVVYLPVNVPIRRAEMTGEGICRRSVTDEESGRVTHYLVVGYNCPFIAGDVIEIIDGSNTHIVNVLSRTAELSTNDSSVDANVVKEDMAYLLEASSSDLSFLSRDGSTKEVDIRRVITDRTACEAPYDEMYIDYVCAQICFYQRKHDIYQQHIARYNARMEEYARFIKELAAENDNTVFRNWWRL